MLYVKPLVGQRPVAVKQLAPTVRQLLLETLQSAHRCVESLPVRVVFMVLHHVLSMHHLLWSRVAYYALDGWHADSKACSFISKDAGRLAGVAIS